MQQALIQTTGLICRLWLAAFFMFHVAAYIVPGTTAGLFGLSNQKMTSGTVLLDAGVIGILALIAIWLLFGIYSRVVALVGIVICTASAALYAGSVFTPERGAALVAVAILAFTGGGRLRLHPGGWRVRDTL
ncbi:MAG: hypothetical protein IBX58_11155 [Roseovarius sp.]|nr:hypothetical protein [Roseovarius sp.]